MKPSIHPDYREVVFQDVTSDFLLKTRSTRKSKETIQWTDGKQYPLIKIDVSCAARCRLDTDSGSLSARFPALEPSCPTRSPSST